MVIHTTVTTHRLGCEVARSAFPSMFWSWDRQRHRQNYLREMEFAIDVEGCMESWRGRVCPECQGRHILLEGSVSGGVLWHLPPLKGVMALHCWRWSGLKGDTIEFHPLDVSGCSWVFLMKFCDKVRGMNIFPRFPGIMLDSVSFPFDQVSQFPVNHLTIQDLFHDSLFFSIYDFQERGREWMLSGYRVFWCGG